MPVVYMVCGNTGAGKSTCARQLAAEHGAICFSIDPWMYCLYGEDYDPDLHSFDWVTRRVGRVRAQIKLTAAQILQHGGNVVLDFGFGLAKERREMREWALSLGASVRLYYLDIPVEIRRERVQGRNRERGETFAFLVTDEMFDYVEPMFEPPTPQELEGGRVIR